ncbi:transporter family-2 protein [Tumebacillus sp. BK434]|uniref:DMT family transporter n=1 Tax=Tumebacillus sp. BK434 TaxID=2512169 RepID=UPI001051F827|nr:DMT family transporter [Tumebacillus sp. BK434]TCP57908.1 transporter family-2 protein [Tumebacillus sp. BK434]
MRGILFAFAGGALITLQGVANARISADVGAWQAAAMTQFTGCLAALLFVLLLQRDGSWHGLKQVRPLYLTGGTFGAVVVFGNIAAIQQIGVTVTVAAVLIAQLCLTFWIDKGGWFGVAKQQTGWRQVIGIGMMIAGVMIMKL